MLSSLLATPMSFGSAIAFAAMLCAASVFAALPPRSPESLKESSHDIVVGDVQRVYTSERLIKDGFADTLYVIELKVKSSEKGSIAAGQLIYARAWSPSQRPTGWAGPQGQNLIPNAGDTVRLYLGVAADGGLDLITPNGAELAGK